MSSVTLPQAKLMKRTAWMNMQIEERRRRGEMPEPEAVTETCAASGLDKGIRQRRCPAGGVQDFRHDKRV